MNQSNHVIEPHLRIQDDLKAYYDGELPWLRRMMVRRHLEACSACREEVQTMQTLRENLRDSAGRETPFTPALRERILAQVAGIPPLPAPRRAPKLVQYGLAASLAINCLFLFLLNRSGTTPSGYLAPSAPTTASPVSPGVSVPSGAYRQKHHSEQEQKIGGRPYGGPTSDSLPPRPAMALPAAQSAPIGLPSVAKDLEQPNSEKPTVPAARVSPAVSPAVQHHDQMRPEAMTSVMSDVNVLHVVKRASHNVGRLDSPPGSSPALSTPGGSSEFAPAPLTTPSPDSQVAAAPPAAPLPRAFALGGGGAGFGSDTTTMEAKTERDKPLALNTWPVLTPLLVKTVEADWLVDVQGNASDIRFTATGSAIIDAAIRDAIRQNHYLPAVKDHVPIAARMSHTFVISQ